MSDSWNYLAGESTGIFDITLLMVCHRRSVASIGEQRSSLKKVKPRITSITSMAISTIKIAGDQVQSQQQRPNHLDSHPNAFLKLVFVMGCRKRPFHVHMIGMQRPATLKYPTPFNSKHFLSFLHNSCLSHSQSQRLFEKLLIECTS